MCGILGVVARTPVNQLLYDGLLVLQHRGQDAAGIVTADGANLLVDVSTGLMRSLVPASLRVAVFNQIPKIICENILVISADIQNS